MNRTRILAAALGVVVLTTFPSWAPVPSKVTLQEEAESARLEARGLRTQTERAKAALRDKATIDARLDALAKAVPAGPDLPGLITQLRTAADSAGLQWVAGSPQRSPGNASGSSSWTLTTTLIGRAAAVPIFIDELRRTPRLVVVDSVAYQNITNGQVSATLTLRFYATAAIDAKAPATSTTAPTAPDVVADGSATAATVDPQPTATATATGSTPVATTPDTSVTTSPTPSTGTSRP